MSMDRCTECERYIDTDDDPDCYYDPSWNDELKPWENALCEWCREDWPLVENRPPQTSAE